MIIKNINFHIGFEESIIFIRDSNHNPIVLGLNSGINKDKYDLWVYRRNRHKGSGIKLNDMTSLHNFKYFISL